MPVNYQIIPPHVYPHQFTQINDNTEVSATYNSASSNVTALLCVFASPKGRDNKVLTISGGQAEFMKEYGLGPFALYGQPLLNAYNAALGGDCTLHCMRVTADDASYSNATLVAKYKVTNEEVEKKVDVKFFLRPSDAELTDLDALEDACTVSATPDEEGFIAVKLMTIAAQGRGKYGANFAFRITSDTTTDKDNVYKNYQFSTISNDGGSDILRRQSVVFNEDAYTSGMSLFSDDVINDEDSTAIVIKTFQDGFTALYEAYKTIAPNFELSIGEFDPLFGINKYTKTAIPNYTIIAPADAAGAAANEYPVSPSAITGIALLGGSDGALDAAQPADTRKTALDALYLKAFTGEIDPLIKSKNRYPSTLILDANFDVNTKLAIAALCEKRTDCMAMLDFGTAITTKASVKAYYDANLAAVVNNRVETLEPYCMKIRDPYSQKIVTVTSTYWLAGRYPAHIAEWNGKHRPLAGNNFGIIEGAIKNSIYPIFDEDLDSETMDELAEAHINFAKYNSNQVVVRAMQDTAQKKRTNLSEQNNVLILLDIKRDCERLCAQYEYDFSEVSDIARFNADVEVITARYADAQVRSISAHFEKNAWEAERGILHLYVEMVHKDLVRTTIIEIDVNRSEG